MRGFYQPVPAFTLRRIVEKMFGFYIGKNKVIDAATKEAPMDFGSVNWLAVLVCVIVSMVSGSLWYNLRTFFPAWWKVVGKENQQPGMRNMAMTWALTVLSSFVQAVAMSFMVDAMGNLMPGGLTLTTGASIG